MTMMGAAAHDAAGADLSADMDRLSLVRALHDFDVANARVIDLTQRLITMSHELAAAREQTAVVQREHEDLRSAYEQVQRSRAFRLARKVLAIRHAL